MNDIARLDVDVDSAPSPGLLRPRIADALAERAAAAGPEQVIGQAVADAVFGAVAGVPHSC